MNDSLSSIESCSDPFIRGDHDRALSCLRRVPLASEVGRYRVDRFMCDNTWSSEMILFIYGERSVPDWYRKKCDYSYRSTRNRHGEFFGVPLLHLAAHHSWIDVLDELLSNKAYKVDSNATVYNETALHFVARQGNLEVVKYLYGFCKVSPLRFSKPHNIPCFEHPTPLHYACGSGKLEIVKYFIEEAKLHPESESKSQSQSLSSVNIYSQRNNPNRPLHFACLGGHIEVVKYLLPLCKHYFNSCGHCNYGGYGRCSPLELACVSKSLDLVHFLVLKKGFSPTFIPKHESDDRSVLHLAVSLNNVEIAKFLLSTGKVEPRLIWNKLSIRDEMKNIFKPFGNFYKRNLIEDVLQVFIVGNSGVGKSTLVEAMLQKAKNPQVQTCDEVVFVEPNTVGIALSRYRNMLIHDFAGHHEYYSGHSALVEDVLKQSATLFLCVVDISQPVDTIKSQVTYWLDFLESKLKTNKIKQSSLIVVGSHVDKLSEAECTKKREIVMSLSENRIVSFEYKGFIHIDCRKVFSGNLSSLISMITKCHNSMNIDFPRISCYCVPLHKYLTDELQKDICTISELVTALKEKDCYYLPSEEDVLIGFLRELHNTGIIMLFEDCKWLVLKKEVLLTEVNGKLFAPQGFKEHVHIASNTGIVTSSDLSVKSFLIIILICSSGF